MYNLPDILFPDSNAYLSRNFVMCSIFVPSESNPLLDKLLARGINGESPSKGRRKSRARSQPKSPSKRKGQERAVDTAQDELGDTGVKHTGRDKRKSETNVRDAATKKKKAPVRKKKKDVVTVPDVAEEQPVAGALFKITYYAVTDRSRNRQGHRRRPKSTSRGHVSVR